jgi:hypothetical protein
MNVIAIGDIHGKSVWEKFKNLQFDKFIFIGDYFDSFDIPPDEQVRNFQNITDWAREDDRVELLIGNHDFHYIVNDPLEQYSGFQTKKAALYRHLLEDNKDLLKMAVEIDGVLYSHAGVTEVWANRFGIKKADDINRLPLKAFYFEGRDPYGDDVTQSPIWVRPYSLLTNYWHPKQVVGHTRVESLFPFGEPPTKAEVLFIDVLDSEEVAFRILDGNIKKHEKIHGFNR